jgi:hypothetical protein
VVTVEADADVVERVWGSKSRPAPLTWMIGMLAVWA